MKKVLCFLLCLLLFFFAAACDSENLVNNQSSALFSEPESIVSEAAAPESSEVPAPELTNSRVNGDRFTLSVTTILDQIDLERELSTTVLSDSYTEGDMKVFWKVSKSVKLFVYTDFESEKVSAISIQIPADSDKSTTQLWMAYFKALIPLCGITTDTSEIITTLSINNFVIGETTSVIDNGVDISFTLDNDKMIAYFMPSNSAVTISELPTTAKSDQDPIIGNQETLEHLNALSENLSLTELVAYINENGNPESTYSQDLIKKANEVMAALENCDIVHDGFEDKDFIYYHDLQSISYDVNILPYITVSKTGMSFYKTIGFKDYEWLFFDEIKIKVGEDDYISHTFKSWDVDTEVIDGGIKETITYAFPTSDAEKIISYDGLPDMRFINNDNKNYKDHAFTESEKSAVVTLFTIDRNLRDINDTLYRYITVLP